MNTHKAVTLLDNQAMIDLTLLTTWRRTEEQGFEHRRVLGGFGASAHLRCPPVVHQLRGTGWNRTTRTGGATAGKAADSGQRDTRRLPDWRQ